MIDVSSTGGYRIRTGVHTPVGSDVARDERDVMVSSSSDGVTGWTARQRVNDDVALYDDWLPEVAVPTDGNAYLMWFDWRDTPASCFGGSNIYLSRSTDGGSSWAANQAVTTATTANWTQVLSNIAPNQGDYNGMYGGDCVAMAFADGRLGDADVFTARLTTGYTVACGGDQKLNVGQKLVVNTSVSNLNQMFGNSYSYSLSVDRNWAGYPLTGNTSAAALGSGPISLSIIAPDSAADGEVVHACLTVYQNGTCGTTCCFNIMVNNPVTAALGSLASSSAEPGLVSLMWYMAGGATANVYRTDNGAGWTLMGRYTAGYDGYLKISDTNVSPGARYGYRLGILSGGSERTAGEAWVTVPVRASFAINHVFPSPSPTGFSVDFSLPSKAPATLELIDLSGRRVLAREVGAMGAGAHTLSLEDAAGKLPAGIYALRLTQGPKVASAKVSLIR
jgi:hypothetical protein